EATVVPDRFEFGAKLSFGVLGNHSREKLQSDLDVSGAKGRDGKGSLKVRTGRRSIKVKNGKPLAVGRMIQLFLLVGTEGCSGSQYPKLKLRMTRLGFFQLADEIPRAEGGAFEIAL